MTYFRTTESERRRLKIDQWLVASLSTVIAVCFCVLALFFVFGVIVPAMAPSSSQQHAIDHEQSSPSAATGGGGGSGVLTSASLGHAETVVFLGIVLTMAALLILARVFEMIFIGQEIETQITFDAVKNDDDDESKLNVNFDILNDT